MGIPVAADGAHPAPALTPLALRQHWPMAVVGGGLAGCAAAARLAHNGWPVLLLERDTFPRDKLCGEFLSGESRALLEQLGCLDAILARGATEIRKVKFVTIKGREVSVPLPVPALGISRRVLDEVLFHHAAACGATALAGWDVVDIVRESGPTGSTIRLQMHETTAPRNQPQAPALSFTCDLLMAAYGRRSKLDRQLQRPFLQDLDGSVGIKLHHRIAPGPAGEAAQHALAATTEMYALDGGYCGIAPIENGAVNVCMLLQRRAFARLGTVEWPKVAAFLSKENAALGRRLAGLVPEEGAVPLTVSQMPFSKQEPWRDDMMFVGDAAAMIAPLCGDGMAMALQSGILAADAVQQVAPAGTAFTDGPKAALRDIWCGAWRQTFRPRLRAGYHLQKALLSPSPAEILAATLKTAPSSVTKYLAKITRG